MKILRQNKNKIILVSFLLLMIYTSFQTFLTNDDLAYSFIRYKEIRITNISQIILNNLHAYNNWTGRFFIHCIIQTLLLFGKDAWSIINPTILTIYIIILTFIETKLCKKKEYTMLLLINIVLFLSITKIKYLIYWVSGTVNYIWPLTLILYYTYKKITDDEYENYVLLFLISILQELSLVYILVFTIINIYIKYKRTKKVNIKPLIPIILGGTFLMAAPGNFVRLNNKGTANIIIQYMSSLRTTISLIFDIKQPLIILYLIINMFKISDKKIIVLYISILIGAQFECLLYIPLIMLIMIYEKNKMIALPFYVTVAFMSIIPSYEGVHPHIYIFTYMIVDAAINITKIPYKKALTILFALLAIFYSIKDYKIYKDIGQIKKERLENIKKLKENNEKILELKKVKNVEYLIDPNGSDILMDTQRYIKKYYNLNENVTIKFVD